ncbi:vesicle transport protein SFT2B [Morus notabilis]|uniref:vesicle transport protein SFT2B n=1 Tax=Morus notabilis TaxID=981085 RepID=UPI000CED7D32|nr:vesicle transport protein SFT2B [Morus notabilis]
MWAKLKQSMSGDDDDEGGGDALLDDESDNFFSLSQTQRIYAFTACLLAGLVCMFLSMIVFAKPIKFALLFTFGNVLAVGSTTFLIGAGKQMRMMFDSARVYATAIYLGCVVLALICAFWIHSKILTILAIIVEICALVWSKRWPDLLTTPWALTMKMVSF